MTDRTAKILRRCALAVVVLAAVAFGVVSYLVGGPRNLIGMMLYDQREEGSLRVGDPAPDIALTAIDDTIRASLLADRKDGKAQVLIFGSFTWPPFRRSVERLVEMAERYDDRAIFRTVYIKEAHPEEEWQMDSNEEEGVCYRQPRSLEDRLAIAGDFVERFDYPIPLLVDDLDNAAMHLYSGWPERLYIVGADGRIAYKGEPGPFGFHPEEVEAWLDAHPPPAASPVEAAPPAS